ncbi:MAG: 16S rRNA processing protein RimM [Clostridia bacterium]|nr:16S rRNA processing protein RimM [Clostridia bacterium]
MKQNFLEAGRVRNTHALRGEVKFECWLDGEKPLSGISHLYLNKTAENPLKVLSARRQGDVFLVLFEGVDTVEKAGLLKGKTLFVSREEADPKGDKVYFADLLGLPLVEEETGETYGVIREVTSRGASELFLVLLPDGREVYFPAVKEFIVKMDAELGVFVHAPKGIFD